VFIGARPKIKLVQMNGGGRGNSVAAFNSIVGNDAKALIL
jgi:hypothetical protein